MLLASRNREGRVASGRQFAKWTKRISRKFRKNRKNGHFLQSLSLKMVGSLQLKLSTSTPAGRKACDLCPPENLSGDHRKHRGKCENSGFSPALQKDQFSLKISSKNEKNDQKTGRRRIFKMVQVKRFWTNFSPPPKMRIFQLPQDGVVVSIILRTFAAE